MATKAAALHAFFSQFLTAYPAENVPSDAEYPYLTYELATAAWGEGETPITLNLWYWTESEAVPNATAQSISEAVGLGGKVIACENGAIWLKRGSPFCQAVPDINAMIKRRYINLSAEYFTAD